MEQVNNGEREKLDLLKQQVDKLSQKIHYLYEQQIIELQLKTFCHTLKISKRIFLCKTFNERIFTKRVNEFYTPEDKPLWLTWENASKVYQSYLNHKSLLNDTEMNALFPFKISK